VFQRHEVAGRARSASDNAHAAAFQARFVSIPLRALDRASADAAELFDVEHPLLAVQDYRLVEAVE
jgi:hypothetical protein